MLRTIFQRFEDTNHPLLGPTLWGLKYFGIKKSPKNAYFTHWIHVVAIIINITQFIELWRIRSDIKSSFHSFSLTLECFLANLKVWTTIVFQKSWENLVNYVSSLELSQISTDDVDTKKKIKKYTKYSRNITYFYWFIISLTMSTEIFMTLFSYLLDYYRQYNYGTEITTHVEVFNSWTPFDTKKGWGCWIMYIVQGLYIVYVGISSFFYDLNIIVLMSFFVGQMKILSQICFKLFENSSELSYEDLLNRIKNCHEHHLSLIKNAKILNSVLSPVMFPYVVICSLILCTNVIQFTSNENTGMDNVGLIVYMVACLSQLFLYCWHCNEVLVTSELIDKAVYSSNWLSCDVRIRRSVLLLVYQVRKKVFFTAGPFVDLNLNTFISIMKASYSYYTILSQVKE